MSTSEPRNRVFFDHIYKAAGSSIDQALISRFGQAGVTSCLTMTARDALAKYRERSVVTGHFNFLPGDSLDPSRLNITMLREPTDRLVSHYYFARNTVVSRLPTPVEELTKSLALEEYIDCNVPDVANLLCNNQVMHFAALERKELGRTSDDALLRLAKSALDRYDIVGVFHRIDDFVDLLFYIANWGLAPIVEHKNRTVHRIDIRDLPSELRAQLLLKNELDTELYDYASRRFAAQFRHSFRHAVSTTCDASECIPSTNMSTLRIVPPKLTEENATVMINSATITGSISNAHRVFSGEEVSLRILLTCHGKIDGLSLLFRITDEQGQLTTSTNTVALGDSLSASDAGTFATKFRFTADFGIGTYKVCVGVLDASRPSFTILAWQEDACQLQVASHVGFYFDGIVRVKPHVSYENAGSDNDIFRVSPLENTNVYSLCVDTPALLERAARIAPATVPLELLRGETVSLRCEVVNVSSSTWKVRGNRPVALSYHWLTERGEIFLFDGLRSGLSLDVPPGDATEVFAMIKAPLEVGTYYLQLNLVQEHVGWFDAPGIGPHYSIKVVDSSNTSKIHH